MNIYVTVHDEVFDIVSQVDIQSKGKFIYSTDFEITNGIIEVQTCYMFKKNLI